MKSQKYNRLICIFICILCLLMSSVSVGASSGKLKKASIIECNGQSYGNHGKDNHWHRAVKHDAGWYPNGENLGYNNPCKSQPNPEPIVEEKPKAESTPKQETLIKDKPKTENPSNSNHTDSNSKVEAPQSTSKQIEILKVKSSYAITSTIPAILPITNINDVNVVFNQDNVTYTKELKYRAFPFKENTIVIKVSSSQQERSYEYPAYLYGSNRELLSLESLQLKYDQELYTISEGQFTLNLDNSFDEKLLGGVYLNGNKIINEATYSVDKDYNTLTVKSTYGSMQYTIPLKVIQPEDSNLLSTSVGGIAILSSIGAGVLYVHKSRKKKLVSL